MSKPRITTKLHKLAGFYHATGHSAMTDPQTAPFFKAAHYVVTPGLVEVMERSDIAKSIMAVHEAGITSLPFPEMLIEFECLEGFREFVLLRQYEHGLIKGEYAFIMRHDQKGEFSRSIMKQGYPLELGEEFGVMLPQWDVIEVKDGGYLHRVYGRDDSASSQLIDSLTGAATFALNVAFLCLNMQGVEKEVVECHALNKARAKTNKPPIPRHTSLYVGRVWRRDGTSIKMSNDGAKRTVRVHMRSAHTRNQRVGKGRTETKLVYIPPILVNYHPGDEMPTMPKRKVYL